MTIEKRDWTFVYSEGHSMLLNEAFFNAFTNYYKVPGIFKEMMYVNKNGLEVCYTTKSEIERVRQQGKKFFSSSYRKQFQSNIKKCAENFSLFWKEYNKINFSGLTNNQLLLVFERYLKYLEPMLAHYQVSGGRSYPLLEEYVKNQMAKHIAKNSLQDAYATLLTSTELDLLGKENAALLKLSEKRMLTEKNLLAHAKYFAYAYLCTYEEKQVLASLKTRLKKLRKKYKHSSIFLFEQKKRKMTLQKEQKKIMKKLPANQKLIGLIEFLRNQGKLRFDYKEWFFGAEYKFLKIFKEISRRLKLPLKKYMYSYRIDDTRIFLRSGKKLARKEIKKRHKIFIFLQLNGKKHFFSGKGAKRIKRNAFPSLSRTREVKGITANAGAVTGRAHIILPKSFSHLEEAMKKFKQGEILITPMTQPNLVVIMKKAAAIVTNQGGITSHAAVLSRELKIPCVVGTLTATETFATGDLIEVNANEGIVKKL